MMNELTPDEHRIMVDAIHDSATVIHKGRRMNERIRQLAEQAGMYIVDDEFSTYGKFAEKFAELIVEECCLVLEQTQTALDRHKWPTPTECGVYIKEHFGVRE